MNFIDNILSGFNSIIDFLGSLFDPLFKLISGGFNALLDFLEKPLSLVYYFFEGIFYFISKIFDVVVLVIQIFIAFFQFLGSISRGLFNTLHYWLIPNLSDNTHFPSASDQGFQTIMDLLQPTGLLTVVPVIAIALTWIYFVMKVVALFGGDVSFNGSGKRGG
jgi:hypothetical protein